MASLLNTLQRFAIVLLLTAAAASAQTAPPPVAPRPCTGFDEIAADRNNPFTAQIVTNSKTQMPDGTQKPTERVEFVARDGDGRIRMDRDGFVPSPTMQASDAVTLYTREGETIHTTRQEVQKSVIIQDCRNAKMILLQPGMRVAHVTEGPAPPLVTGVRRPLNRATNLLSGKPNSLRSVDDLGTEKIEGIEARGVMQTTFGTTEDGEWKGKAIKTFEIWASDDLGVTILEIRTNLKDGSEYRKAFTKIKRVEPDPALFEIPARYKVNPDEMPYQSDHGRLTFPPK